RNQHRVGLACVSRHNRGAAQSAHRHAMDRPAPCVAGDCAMKWPWSKKEKRDNDPSWSALIPSGTSAGLPVSPGNAETISTVFSCVQSIAETVATLPLILYRR